MNYCITVSTQPSIPPGSVNEYQLRLGRQRQVWHIPIADERVDVQVKLWNPLRTRAMPERFCGGDSLRRGAISSVWTFTFVFCCVVAGVFGVGSALEWRYASGERRLSVWAGSARPSKPRQLVRVPRHAAGPALYALQAADRTRRPQVALHGQQLHELRRLVLTIDNSSSVCDCCCCNTAVSSAVDLMLRYRCPVRWRNKKRSDRNKTLNVFKNVEKDDYIRWKNKSCHVQCVPCTFV